VGASVGGQPLPVLNLHPFPGPRQALVKVGTHWPGFHICTFSMRSTSRCLPEALLATNTSPSSAERSVDANRSSPGPLRLDRLQFDSPAQHRDLARLPTGVNRRDVNTVTPLGLPFASVLSCPFLGRSNAGNSIAERYFVGMKMVNMYLCGRRLGVTQTSTSCWRLARVRSSACKNREGRKLSDPDCRFL